MGGIAAGAHSTVCPQRLQLPLHAKTDAPRHRLEKSGKNTGPGADVAALRLTPSKAVPRRAFQATYAILERFSHR